MTDIPFGKCYCGCGGDAPRATQTRSDLGIAKGEPRRFIAGHYARLPRAAEPERFWSKVEKTADCWFWRAYRDKRGYGKFSPAPDGTGRKVRVYAHRWSYEAIVGPIPDGLVLDHLCRMPSCVNPDHLEPVTDFENKCRGLTSPLKSECLHGHPYTPENTYTYRGKRQCRTCRRQAVQRYESRRSVA